MASKRAVCLLGAAVAFILITNQEEAAHAGNEHSVVFQTSITQMFQSAQNTTESLDQIVQDATRDGGSIVHCDQQHHCQDLNTHEDVGQARAGLYVVFPNEPKYKGKLDQYQKRIRDWMNAQ